MKAALDEMRKELRGRVGKKLLSIEVHSHAEGEDPEAPDADDGVSGDDVESKKQKKIGMPLLG